MVMRWLACATTASTSSGLRDLATPSKRARAGIRSPFNRSAGNRTVTPLTLAALGGNLGGITTQLLGLDGGKLAERLQLNAVYPVRGLKRCVDGVYGFEFQYPASWLADQTVAYRAAQRAEASRALDMPPLARPPRQRPNVYEPVAAYGPAGSSGEENVSVIVAPIFEGFNLSAMGSPEKVATQFLATIAPEGSAKEAHLLSASSRAGPDGNPYYRQGQGLGLEARGFQGQGPGARVQGICLRFTCSCMEYTVKGPNFARHNLSVITSKNDRLFTFNAQAPITLWEQDAEGLRAAARSFALTSSRIDTTGFPARL
ncbi:hypothetical protein QJQ45_024587 [Haematococcus lacustris]|nr:hypothetical protein QJQ45_024587 [Haematococcus lacustris]